MSLINVSKKLKTWKRSKYDIRCFAKSRPRIILRSACDLPKQRIFSILCSCDMATFVETHIGALSNGLFYLHVYRHSWLYEIARNAR